MSQLFVSLYLEEDVDVLLARLLQSRGFSALTTHDAGQLGKTDADQLTFAAARRLAIVTHNRADFEKLAADYIAAGRMHAGIFIAVRRPPYDIARRLLVLLNQVTADEMENQALYL